MRVFFIMLIWAIMAAILVAGIVMAVGGHFWLLIVGVLAFIAALTKYGIYSH